MIGVIIIGGHVQGLGLIRMLGTHGIPAYLLDTDIYNISRYSKYCKRFIKLPADSYDSSEKFANILKEIHDYYDLHDWIIFPTDDLTVAYLSKNSYELSKYFKIWVQDWEHIKYCYDKKLTYKIAEKIGISIPKTYFPKDISDLNEVNYLFQYPLIIKPAIMHEFYKKTNSKVYVVNNKEELKEKYIKTCTIINQSDIIIQEIIKGEPKNLYSFCSFFKNGEVIASITGQRSRQIPMDFGKASTLVESINIPELYDIGKKLLGIIDYYGLSEVEFKKDLKDNKFKLLEINPRTWKWHLLAFKCGINLPYLLYCDLIGEKINFQNSFRNKLKWIDFYSDMYISINEILKGNLSIRNYFESLTGEKMDSVFSFDDPKPFIMETILLPYLFKSR